MKNRSCFVVFFHLKGHAETSNWDLISKHSGFWKTDVHIFFKKTTRNSSRKKEKKLTSVISLWLAGSTIRSIDWEFPMPSPQANSMNDNKYLSCPRGAINFPSYIEHSIHSHRDNNNTQKPAAVFCLFVNELPLSTCFQCLILQVYNTCSTTWSNI